MALKLSKENFEQEVLKSEIPVLVDFWAAWCGPCKAIAPIIDELSVEYVNTCKICKLNVDDEQDIAKQYGIMSIPTLIMFKNGVQADKLMGLRGKPQLKEFINKYL